MKIFNLRPPPSTRLRDQLRGAVVEFRGRIAARIAPPEAGNIRWSALRGTSDLEVSLPGGLAAGVGRHWDLRLQAPENGVLMVFANTNVENFDVMGSQNTSVVLSVELDGARIGRSAVSLASGASTVISTIAPIMISSSSVKPGFVRPRITLKSTDANLTLGEMNATALFLPATWGRFVGG